MPIIQGMVGGYPRSGELRLRLAETKSLVHPQWGRWITLGVLAGLASLALAPLSPALTGLVHGVTLIAIAGLLMWGPRRREPLARTRRLLVAALGAALLSELMLVAYELIAGSAPSSPWAADYVAFLYTPLTIAGLLLVPGSRDGAGHRVRALCDGLFAAGSVWFLVAAVADTELSYGLGRGEWAETATLVIAAGDVCVVATALTVLSRCSLSVARTVGGIAAGITVIAVDDIWLLVSGGSGYSWMSVTLVQVGLLLLLLTAALPPVSAQTSLEGTTRVRRRLGVLPFLPMLACFGVMLDPILDDGRRRPRADRLAPSGAAPADRCQRLPPTADPDRLRRDVPRPA